MILINFKTYRETWGDNAVELGKIIKEEGDKNGVEIVVATSALDAYRVRQESGAKVWLQAVDEQNPGKSTGHISALQAKEVGVEGTLLNHYECQIPKGKILKIIGNKPDGFKIMLCVKSLGQIEKWARNCKADYILYEPPELIASKEASVATAKSESIKKAVELAGSIPLIVGAGIKSKEDVEVSLKLGAVGVGLSSAFVLAKDPINVLNDIISGFGGKNY